jgi:hypothetical protein
MGQGGRKKRWQTVRCAARQTGSRCRVCTNVARRGKATGGTRQPPRARESRMLDTGRRERPQCRPLPRAVRNPKSVHTRFIHSADKDIPILRAYACYQCANVVWLDLVVIGCVPSHLSDSRIPQTHVHYRASPARAETRSHERTIAHQPYAEGNVS